MATLVELAELSAAAYGKPAPNGWQQIAGPDGRSENAKDNYVGVAYQKGGIGGKIAIANRGTLPSKVRDLLNDAELTVHGVPHSVQDAITFALQVANDHPGATITETGHSLGGYEAQALW